MEIQKGSCGWRHYVAAKETRSKATKFRIAELVAPGS